MATAEDVKNYIKTKLTLAGEVQLQKLVYYCQAWNMVWNGAPLFREPIEAWRMGPVVRSLRHSSLTSPAGPYNLSDAEQAAIDAVIQHYGVHYGWALSEMTHQEVPWRLTRGDLPDAATSDREISRRLIRTFHTEQSLRGEGPSAPSAQVQSASEDAAVHAAVHIQERWQEAHALLAK